MIQTLAAYVLAAMLAWVPIRQQVARGEPAEQAQARYEAIARDIASEAADPDEAPVVRDADAVVARAKTALLVASLAFWESRYWVDVDEGRCRKELGAFCDNGSAWTLWQVHDEDGLVLEQGHFVFARERPDAVLVYRGEDLVRERRVAVRVVLAMLRTGGVTLWTPGKQARDMAVAYYQRHPFTPEGDPTAARPER